jgi:hypothetical protein
MEGHMAKSTKKAGPKVKTGTKSGGWDQNHNLVIRFAKPAPKGEKQDAKGSAKKKAGPKVKSGTKGGGGGLWGG